MDLLPDELNSKENQSNGDVWRQKRRERHSGQCSLPLSKSNHFMTPTG